MNKHALLLICLLVFINAEAQKFTHEFGVYSNEDFELKECSFEPAAEAVVLYDIGKSMFDDTDYGYNIYFERRVKIKILKKAGLKYAEFSVPVYYDKSEGAEKIVEIRGNTYNYENGTVRTTSFNPKETYTQKINEHWNLKKFAIPDVKEGSVFEIQYIINSPYIFNLRDWEFQGEIPVYYSEYTAIINPHFEYFYYVQGISKFDEFKTYTIHNNIIIRGGQPSDDMAYFFVLKNVPSFKDDEFISSPDDYRIKINFQLSTYSSSSGVVTKIITTWPELIKELLKMEEFGRYLKQSQKKGEEVLATLSLPSDNIEKIKYLRNYVAHNFSFNGYDTKYANQSVKDFVNKKIGNSAEINLFFLGLLNAAGIQADPVIISTRNYGKIRSDYPFLEAFNYALVSTTIDGKPVLLDATESLLDWNEIPSRCLNESGLLVKSGEPQWMKYGSFVTSEVKTKAEMTIDAANTGMRVTFDNEYTGYDGASARNSYLKDYDRLYEELVSNNSRNTDSIRQVNLYNVEQPFSLRYMENNPLEIVDQKIVLDPFLRKGIYENPLKEPTRNYPIDFTYRKIRSFETIINIPEGYRILSKPDDFVVNNPDVRMLYMTDDKTPGVLKVTMVYEFKKDSYQPEVYSKIKGYYNNIVNKFNEKIVLEPSGI